MNKEKLESAKALLFTALTIDVAITVLVVISNFWAIGVLKDIAAGRVAADPSLISTLEFWDSFAKLMILSMLGVGFGLVKWLNSCYSFAKETIGASGFKNQGWTLSGWIIPIFNLFKPYQVINEIYRAGSPTYAEPDGWKKESGSGWLLTWWIFWAVTHFIGSIVSKQLIKNALREDMTLQQSIGAIEFQAWFCVTFLVISALWFFVANEVTQRLLERRVFEGAPPSPVHTGNLANQAHVASQAPKQPTSQPPMRSESFSVANLQEKTDNPALHIQNIDSTPSMSIEAATEEDHWAIAMAEVESGQRRPGVWAKAFADSDGDETKAKVAYLRARVQQLADGAIALRAQKDAIRQEEAAKVQSELLARTQAVQSAITLFENNKEVSNEQLTFVVEYVDKAQLVSVQNSFTGNSLLHVCAERNMTRAVHSLLAAGADANRSNNSGVRPEFMTSDTLIRQLCNGLKVAHDQLEVLIHPPLGVCPNCDDVIPLTDLTCPECHAMFGPSSAWGIRVMTDEEILGELKLAYLTGKKPTPNQVKYLVAASINDKSLIALADERQHGATLLHWCGRFNFPEQAKLLLGNGANAKAKTSAGQMPYEWCEKADLRSQLEAAALDS